MSRADRARYMVLIVALSIGLAAVAAVVAAPLPPGLASLAGA